MAYILSKLEERQWLDRERAVHYLHWWDFTQSTFAAVVRVGVIPATVLFASVHAGVPLWAVLSPVG